MKKLYIFLFVMSSVLLGAQVCNSSGNLMIFTNYDGGTLTINVDQNIPNIKIGICSYEGVSIHLTGAFVNNVTALRYAGYNGSNNHCGSSINTNFNNIPGTAVTSTVFLPPVTLSNPNGYSSIVCGSNCNNSTSQGGCNTPDQIEAYFLNYFPGSTLYAHKIQYGCWTGTHSLSIGGNCCPPPVVYPGVITGTQSICAGATPTSFGSTSSATVSSGTITYTWQSSTTSPASGFSNIPATNVTAYGAGSLSQTTYYRRAASTVTNNVAYSNVIAVTILPLPMASISGPTAVCAGSSATLTASGGTNYAWSNGGTGATVVISPTVASIITITCFPSNGCSVTASQPLVVNPVPIISGLPVSACIGSTVSLHATGGTSFTWQPGNHIGQTYTFVATASQVYTVTASNSNGCNGMTTIPLTVDLLPIITANSGSAVCSGQTLSISASGAMIYNWKPGPMSGAVVNVTPAVSTVYTLTGMDANGCKDSITVSINVHPSPTVTLQADREKLCKGESFLLSAGGATSYTLVNSTTSMPSGTISLFPLTVTHYTVIGKDGNNCTAEAVKSVTANTCAGIGMNGPSTELKIFPNPNSGEFFIEGQRNASVEITNTNGQIVKRIVLNEKNDYKVSVKDLAPGVYFTVVTSGKETFKQKIIVSSR